MGISSTLAFSALGVRGGRKGSDPFPPSFPKAAGWGTPLRTPPAPRSAARVPSPALPAGLGLSANFTPHPSAKGAPRRSELKFGG